MAPPHLRRDEIEAHFEKMPPQYFRARRAREIVADLELMHTFMVAQLQPETRALEPVLAWHDLQDRGFTRLKVCTWDHRGAFSRIAGALRAAGLDILSAEIYTREEGVLIDTFLVLEDATGELVRPKARARCEAILKDLVAEQGDTLAVHRQQAPRPRRPQPATIEPVPTRITFDNDAVPRRTAIEIEAQDRLGLLYTISRTLSDEGLDISVAKISSGLGVVQDTFYVRDANGSKITDPARQRELAAKLKQAIDELPL
jgi:[protein-PII] uridylyltransferase